MSRTRTALIATGGAAVAAAALFLAPMAMADPGTSAPASPGFGTSVEPGAPGYGGRFAPPAPVHLAPPAPRQLDAPVPDQYPAAHGPASAVPASVEGDVTGFTAGPRGEVDGLAMADGTIVKFGPHEAARLGALVEPGDTVRVEGMQHVTRHGETHLRADTITDTVTGESMSVWRHGLPIR